MGGYSCSRLNVERAACQPGYAPVFWRPCEAHEPEEEPSTSCWAGFPRIAVLIVSSGVIGLEVAAMFLLTSMTLSVTIDFNLHQVQQGLLMSVASLGGLAGALVVGYLADRKGRRPPVLWALASLATFSALASFAHSYHALVGLGFGLGLSLGGGIVPVSVLLSETTREDSRMAVRGVCQCLGGSLGFVMLVAIHLDDPTLQHLNWRPLFRGLAFSSAVLCALAFFCMPESPTFLQASFGCFGGDLEDVRQRIKQEALPIKDNIQDAMTIQSQLDIVFSRRFFFTTVYIGAAGFLAGLVQGGHQYALPQILSRETSFLSPGFARMAISCCGVPMAPAAQCTASKLSRRGGMAALGLSSAVVALSSALLGSCPTPQPFFIELLFFLGMSLDPYRAFLVGLLFGEMGADVYPTTTAGFGASIIAVSMGVATIVAPLLFEGLMWLTGDWTMFYLLVLVLIANFMVCTVVMEPHIEPYSGREATAAGSGRPGQQCEEGCSSSKGKGASSLLSGTYGAVRGLEG